MKFCKSLCVAACFMALATVSFAQEESAAETESNDLVVAATADQADETESLEVEKVQLTEDGGFEGLVFVFKDGEKLPVEAKVSLTRDGVILDSVQADAEGNFSFASVEPGPYSMFASADSMVTSQPIDVAPFDAAILPTAPVQVGISSFDAGYDSYAGVYDSYNAVPSDTFAYSAPTCGTGSCGSSCGGGFQSSCGGGCSGGGLRGGGLRGGLRRLPGWIGLVGLVGLAGDGDDAGTPDN